MFIFWITGIFCFLVLIYIMMILPSFSHKKEMSAYFDVDFAHRGLHNIKAGIPENSLSSFKRALKYHLGIELDIHLTKDKQIVVFHDESLSRICCVEGFIEDMTYEELGKLYLSHTAERIPLFSEVLRLVNGRVPLLIELKLPSQDMELCACTLDMLNSYQGPYLVQSFNSLGIHWYKKNAPHILRGQLSSALTKDDLPSPLWVRFCVEHLLTNLICRPDFISYKLADSRNLSLWLNCHLFHTPAAVWTLRTPAAYEEGKRNYNIRIFEESAISCLEKNKENQ